MDKEVSSEDLLREHVYSSFIEMCKAYVSLSKLKNKFFLNGCHNPKYFEEELKRFDEKVLGTLYKWSYKLLKEQNLTDRFINELHTDNSDDDEEYKD
ncbi:MAG: hypothetical protein ABRQ37_14650 [Candidatus Eremiobacterota bacterium]